MRKVIDKANEKKRSANAPASIVGEGNRPRILEENDAKRREKQNPRPDEQAVPVALQETLDRLIEGDGYHCRGLFAKAQYKRRGRES